MKWRAEVPVGSAWLSPLQIDIAVTLNINTQTSKVANKGKGTHTRPTHRFHPLKFRVGLFTQKMKMHLFGNDVIFCHRVSQYQIIVNSR